MMNVITMSLYITVIVFLVVFGVKIASAAKRIAISPMMTSLIMVGALTYVSCLIPGVVGELYPIVEYCLFIVLSISGMFLLSKINPKPAISRSELPTDGICISLPECSLVVVGLLGATPLFNYLRFSVLSSLQNPDKPLGWDIVSYHLPAFIEFYQNHTLWSLDGPYQSYSFAFELIGNFLSQPSFAHWGLIFANLFAIALLVFAIAAASKQLVSCLPTKNLANWLPCAALTIGIWASIHANVIELVGKNDIFMAACLLAALSFLIEIAAGNIEYSFKKWSIVFLVAVAFGMALSTKPSALAFLPFFPIATWCVTCSKESSFTKRQSYVSAGIVLLVPILLGGFWLARNLLVYGHLSPILGNASKLSILANLGSSTLYADKRHSILFAFGLLAIVPGILLLYYFRRRSCNTMPLKLVVLFHVVACFTFAITPYTLHRFVGASAGVWELRLGMPLFISAALIYSLTTVYVLAVTRLELPRLHSVCKAIQPILVLALIVPYLIVLSLRWHMTGLPGYEVTKGLPRTDVYRWAQNQNGPLRIYSAGLRPYGLYGKGWENRIFYDLHSTKLSPLESGKARIAAAVVDFRPDLILISVDPHAYTGDPKKPEVAKWMEENPDYFEEIYNDETVSGFRVRNSAAMYMKGIIPAGYRLSMGE